MLDTIMSIGFGVATYLFLEYVWRPYLKPKFDRKFLNRSNYYLHTDLQTLYQILDQDWTGQHILPNREAYEKLLDNIIPNLTQYISQREIDNLRSVFDKLNSLVNDKPKPIEIIQAEKYIQSTILIMLSRIALQVPPYTKIGRS